MALRAVIMGLRAGIIQALDDGCGEVVVGAGPPNDAATDVFLIVVRGKRNGLHSSIREHRHEQEVV